MSHKICPDALLVTQSPVTMTSSLVTKHRRTHLLQSYDTQRHGLSRQNCIIRLLFKHNGMTDGRRSHLSPLSR